MIRNILTIAVMLTIIYGNAQRRYIHEPSTSCEPTVYTNVNMGFTKDVKRVTAIDSASHVTIEYGFNRNGLQTYYTEKNGRHVDSMANIYNSNGKLTRNEVYENKINLDYRTYSYKEGNLVFFREVWDEKLVTKTSYIYEKGNLKKAKTKISGTKYCEKYEYIEGNYSVRRKKIGKRMFEITNIIDSKKFKSVEIYDPEDLDFHYEKRIYRYNDDSLLIEFRNYQLCNESEKQVFTYEESDLKNIKRYTYGKLNSETFYDMHGKPLKINYYYSDNVREYENKYNEKGDLIQVKLINDGKIDTITTYEIEYW